ncbi:hypothetical protein DIE06_35745 [Burkholderia sp. Bp8998]|nr:hypothetical protein DIE06_35745 [Burkholderia sp. Bp8998]
MLRTSRASMKRVACQLPREDRTTRHGAAKTRGMHAPAADVCPRSGHATHHAHAIAHRRCAHRAHAHRTIRDGMGIAERMRRHSIRHPS